MRAALDEARASLQGRSAQIAQLEGWATAAGYLDALAAAVRRALVEGEGRAGLLLVARGLSARQAALGDPYPGQVAETAAALQAALPGLPVALCFAPVGYLAGPLRSHGPAPAAWPEQLPMSVRISAHDWVEGGITPADAVEIARAFKAAGADMIDCSSGQVSAQQKPTYGRMYQTPFADRIRQEAGIATIAVGAISEADHVNSILAAGRADLCAVARPHLANPAWTLTEAARIGYTALAWPQPYASGKPQLEAAFARERALQTATKGD